MYLGALLLLAPLSVQVHCDPGYIPNTLQASLEQQQQSSVNITECEFIQRQSDPCEFVRINCKQQDESGMFRYLEGYYCTFRPRQLSIIYIGMLFTLLAFLFLFIGTAAGDYFCPNLNTIANLLGLSENITGVTFLALGNGAPDLFSSFTAIQQDSFSLAMGELMGAASFIVTCVVGMLAITTGFRVNRRPFLRDVLFFIGAIVTLLIVLADGRIKLFESILLIVYYVFYVGVVGVGRFVYQRQKKAKKVKRQLGAQRNRQRQRQFAENSLIEAVDEHLQAASTNIYPSDDDGDDNNHDAEGRPLLQEAAETPDPTETKHVPHGLFINDHASNQYDMHFFKHRAFLHGGQTRRNTLSGGAASPLARALISPDKLLRVATAAGRRQEYYSECVPLKIRSNPDSEESLHLPRQTDSGDGPVHFDDIVSQSSQPSDSAKPRPYVAVEASVSSVPLLPGIEFSTAARIRTRSAATAISIANRGDFIASLKESVASMMPSRSEIITTFLPLHDTWRLQSWRSRLVSVLSLPCIWMLSLTVVVVDLPDDSANDQQPQQPKDESVRLLNDGNNNKNGDDDDYADDNAAIDSDVDSQIVLNPDRWPKWLVLTNCLTAPIFIALGVGVWEEPVGSEPNFTWGLTACLFSLVLFTLTALTSKASRPPKWFKFLCFVGFLSAVVWIYMLANEVVTLLTAIGLIMNISEAILGLTIFAIGNSTGDLVANLTIARMGFPNMAVAACFGSPMLNILLGVGTSTLYYNLAHRDDGGYRMKFTPTLITSTVGVLVALVLSLLAIPFNGWKGRSRYGYLLIAVYCVVMIANLSVEFFR